MKEAEMLNRTPLSKRVAELMKEEKDLPEPDYPSDLILEDAVQLAITLSLEDEPTRYQRYVLTEAQNLLETWRMRYSPEDRYRVLTTNPDLEYEEMPPEELKETREAQEEQILSIAQSEDLWATTEELLSNLTAWFRLEPEFPELL